MIDRAGGEAVAHGQAGVTGSNDDGGDPHAIRRRALRVPYRTSTVTLVGFVIASYTAERFCD